jgi:hypothetical protein
LSYTREATILRPIDVNWQTQATGFANNPKLPATFDNGTIT